MDQPTVQLRENGPIVIQAPVRVLDHLGNEFEVPTGKPTVALCRCGQSARKPFCDGNHKRIGFVAGELAGPKQDIPSGTPPAPAQNQRS